MADESDPPRKFYEFKPREFENVNQVPQPTAAAAPASPTNQRPVVDPGRITVQDLFRQAQGAGPLLSPQARPVVTENEVHGMLRENLARANAAGLNDVAPPTHRFRRRRRDYWVLIICGNTFIAVIYACQMFIGFQVQCLVARMPNEFGNLVRFALANPASYAMGLVGIVFFTGCVTWLMYGVMDDY